MFESLASCFAFRCSASLNMTTCRTKRPRQFPRRGRLSNRPNYRVTMQQPAGQQAPPPQQSASLDEIEVPTVSVIIAAIKSKYFMISPLEIFVKTSAT
jgi:hypothetical protein